MNDITKRKVERINQITDQIAKLDTELVALLGGGSSIGGASGSSGGAVVNAKLGGASKEKRKYTKRELTPADIEKINKTIMECVAKFQIVHPRFVYGHVRSLGYRISFLSVVQYLRHLRDAGKLRQNDTGLYSVVYGGLGVVGGLVGSTNGENPMATSLRPAV